MKKFLLFSFIIYFACNVSGQVFNSSSNLRGNVFSLGLEPTQYGSKNFKLFLHGDLKITPIANLYMVAGLGGNEYLGGGLKWGLTKLVAINTGMHYYNESVGLDGSFIISIPINHAHIVTGIDSNIEFIASKKRPVIPFWAPIGLEVEVSSAISIMLEGEVALNDDAFNIFGGGFIIFL